MSDAEAPRSSLVLYFSEDGSARIQCRLEGDTIWLTKAQMAELFQVPVPTVNEHLSGIYAEAELTPEGTIRKYRIVRTEGTRTVARQIDHYSLAAVLAVGYRVRSPSGGEVDAFQAPEEAARQLPKRAKGEAAKGRSE